MCGLSGGRGKFRTHAASQPAWLFSGTGGLQTTISVSARQITESSSPQVTLPACLPAAREKWKIGPGELLYRFFAHFAHGFHLMFLPFPPSPDDQIGCTRMAPAFSSDV